MAEKPEYIDDEQPEFGRPDSEMPDTCPACGATEQSEDTCAECGEPMQHEQSEQDTLAEKLKNETTLATLGQALQRKFAEIETKRTYIEDRWLEDLRQYHGRYDPGVESQLVEAESCSLFLNISKPKTNAFAARVMDMVLPTDEKNWGLQPTPVPELAQLGSSSTPDAPAMAPQPDGTMAPIATPEGAPVLEKDLVKGIEDEAQDRCEQMELEIDDQLAETRYNGVQRKAIEQMARLGTGIIMGPVILDEWRITWVPQDDPTKPGKKQWVRTPVPNTDKRPGVQWVDCWNFYPDMSANEPGGWEFAFVQYLINKAEFKKYAKRFNFIEDAAKKVIEGGASFNVRTLRWMNELKDLSETQNILDNRFRLLRYYGEITVEDLEAAGLDPEAMGIDDEDSVTGVVWLCEGVILKVDLNPLDSGDMPFSVCYTDKDEASPFGTGIPRLMRGEQESVNAAWRMKHDNAGLSVCPQTVIKINSVTPADGDYHMKPKKIWYVGDEVQNVQNVFAQFAIESHQAELDNILQLGIRFADDVTQLPLLMQGDQAPHITQTAQGMSLLYNASTVVLRRTVKFYDDYVTEPMVSRFFEWNMQFNPRDDIKGDFRAIARGSSTLLDKEQQGQALDMAMQLAMQPTWQPYTDMKKLYQQALKAKRIADILLSDDEIKSNLEKQQQQAAAAAQAGQQPQAAPAGPDPALEQAKIDVKREEIAARREATASAEKIAIARMAQEAGISVQDAQARLAGIKITTDAGIQKFNAELDAKMKTGAGI